MVLFTSSATYGARSCRAALLLGVCAVFPMSFAAAQAPSEAPAQESGLEAEARMDDIVVTGSRIARAGYDTLEPATTLDAASIEAKGTTNVADALATMPSFGIGQSSQGNQGTFNAGQNFVDRFGLGSARTLTVVNGRRFVSTNAPSVQGNVVGSPAPAGLQVDLNVIPTLMVERVDNLSIGGAPAYGSDAIAGVVNIILRKKYDGILMSAQTGITERGDNYRLNLSGLAGTDFSGGRGNVMLGISYDRSDGVLGQARKRIADAYSFQTNPLANSAAAKLPGRTAQNDGRVDTSIPFNTGNGDGIPNSVLIRNNRNNLWTEGGILLPVNGFTGSDLRVLGVGPNGQTRLMFNESGNLVTFNPPTPFSGSWGTGGDGWAIYKSTQILADVERFTANLNASFDLTPTTNIFVESLYFRGEGRELVDQAAYNSPAFGGRNVTTGGMVFSAKDPRLNSEAQAKLAALGVDRFQLSRTWPDLGNGASSSLNQVYRAVLGLRKDFELAERRFTFEASANYGRTMGDFYQNEVIQQRFVNALNAKLDPSGRVVCDPNPAFNAAPGAIMPIADPSCVVLDPFGKGRPTREAVEYVTDRTHAKSALEQTIFSVNLSTPALVDLWAGPIGFSIGFERRREFGSFSPDVAQLKGLTRNAPVAASKGSFTTKEVFGELAIPLVSRGNDIPLIRSLEVEGRGRYVDNSVNGGFFTYTAGGRYEPVGGLTLRGNYTRSLRSPAIVELFMPQAVGVSFFPDPCDTRNLFSGPAPAIRQRNCAAFYKAYGVDPASFSSLSVNAVVPSKSGGNLDLRNEVANAYTFGFIVRPSFLPKLSLAVDWNRIKVKGNIAQLTSADIASGCYDNPNFDLNNPDAGNDLCKLFTRDRSPDRLGQLVSDPLNPGIRSTFVNGAYISFKGLTAAMNISPTPLDGIGLEGVNLSVNGNFYYVKELCTSNNSVTETCTQNTVNGPRYRAQLSATLQTGPFSLFTEVNHQPRALFDRTFTAEQRDILEVGRLTTVNAAVGFAEDDWSMRLTVTNLFDKMPPFPLTTGDLLGRRFVFRVTKSY